MICSVFFIFFIPPIVFHVSGDGLTGTPLTTSARISALNIVGELLRKVGVGDAFVSLLLYCAMFVSF